MSNKNKYNEDALFNSLDKSQTTDSGTSSRRRRPTPALQAMSGEKRPQTHSEKLKADLDEVNTKLAQSEQTNNDLKEQLEEAKKGARDGAPIVLKMPVTQHEVSFELKRIDPGLVDVSPENQRIQEFLDEISLQDILPSIRKEGQQKPGTVRPKADGRYELIEGSRRLASVKLAKQKYLALVGDVPDADIRALSVIENKHKDVSYYEKALAYKRLIENNEYENWTQLGAAKGISSSHISRYKACVELDSLYVRILASPSDMPLSYGETISALKKKDKSALEAKAKELLKQRSGTEAQDADDIIKTLKSAVRAKTVTTPGRGGVRYVSQDGKREMKHTVTNKGATKLEINQISDDELDKVLSFISKLLKVDQA